MARGRSGAFVFALLLWIVDVRAFGISGNGGKGCWFSKSSSSVSVGRSQQSRRKLLQSNCGLQLGDQQLSFASCQSLNSTLNLDFNLLWTVQDGENGGNSTLKAAFDAPLTAGSVDWAAVGFNPGLGMIGGSALIAKICSSCSSGASIDDYYLAAEETSGVTPPSRLAVLSKTAAVSNGRIIGAFEVSLNSTGDALKQVGTIFAAGPVSSSGALRMHDYRIGQSVDFSTGLATSLGPAIAPASGISSAPAPGPSAGPSPSTALAAGQPTGSAPATAPASNCGLQLGDQLLSFAACQSLNSTLNLDLNLLWSVQDGIVGGNSTLKAAFDAPLTAGSVDWAAVGFNPGLGMIGGSALIAKICSSCSSGASIDDYYLAAEETSGVTAPSRLAVLSKTAAVSNGRIIGAFEISLNSTGDALKQVGTIFAAGPVSSSGALRMHDYRIGQSVDFSTGLATSLGPGIAPASGISSAPAPGPSASPSTASTAGQPTGSTAASAPSAGGGCTLQFVGNNSRLSYAQCPSLTTDSTSDSGFRLLWNLRADSSGAGSVLDGAISVSTSSGWAGVGFPATPGVMRGAQAIIVRTCSSCPSGASADKYALTSYDTSGVVAGTGTLSLSGVQAASSGGLLQTLFTINLAASGITEPTATNIIAAIGPVDGSSSLRQHPLSNSYARVIDLQSGSSSDTSLKKDNKPMIHGILMIVGWGLILPLGVVFARCKEWGAIWFHLHRIFQALGYLAGVAGAIVGVIMGRPNGTKLENDHRIIGLVVFILLTTQVSAVFWRPAPGATKLRYSWNALHWFFGGSAIFIAFANVFIGLKISDLPRRWSGLYALAFALILILWSAKLGHSLSLRRRRKRVESSELLHQRQKGGHESHSSDDLGFQTSSSKV